MELIGEGRATVTRQTRMVEEDHGSQREDQPMNFCPVCSLHLIYLRCKLVCERCGYFMSCADSY